MAVLDRSIVSTALPGIIGWELPRAASEPMRANVKKKNTAPTIRKPVIAASVIFKNSFIFEIIKFTLENILGLQVSLKDFQIYVYFVKFVCNLLNLTPLKLY